jgi:decaprenylphospho-beta-D-ribofuranose 2-oxidase
MQVATRRFRRLADLLTEMERTDDACHYSVGWLDCAQRKGMRYRSLLTRAEHASSADLPQAYWARSCEAPEEPRTQIPWAPPFRLANRLSVRALNEAWFRASPESDGALHSLSSFFHPLDAIGNWNLLYGPDGFVQYQFAVPPARADVIESAVHEVNSARVPSFLAVVKRFGPGTPGPLSFSQEGWTLALDFPVGPSGLANLLDRLDERVADAGGRVYLAKDARLRPDLLRTMYPRLPEMEAVRRRVDPEGLLASDLSRRLGMTP